MKGLFASTVCIVLLFSAVMPALAVGADQEDGASFALSQTHLSVPFYYQERDYYCGPAALEMVFDYYGENISQSEIACVARSIGDPLYVTYTDELRRAGHFSNISVSMGDELPSNITGYGLRGLGYAASEAQAMNLTGLRSFLDQGKPLILLMWYSHYHVSTHYRVATGYNETHVFLHDPWNKPLWGGTYGGPDIAFNNSEFLDLWSYYNYWALYVSPWTIHLSAPTVVLPGIPFAIDATFTYPEPLPNAFADYPATACNASIVLPPNMALAPGESQNKRVGTGTLMAGDNSNLDWILTANSSVTGTVTVSIEGLISGFVYANPDYPAYNYNDRIGAETNFTVNITVTSVLPSKTIVGHGYNLNVSVALANPNDFAQNFSVTIYLNQTVAQTGNATLEPQSITAVTLIVNTSSSIYGKYNLTAQIEPLPSGNKTKVYFYASITITVSGDVNGDFSVNIFDAITLAGVFNTASGSPRWNPNADINGDGIVDIYDAIILASNFNKAA